VVDNINNSITESCLLQVLAVCHEAALKALEENLSATDVTHCHFMSALQMVTPRTPSSLLQLYETYLKQS
jgi:AAA family ATPase